MTPGSATGTPESATGVPSFPVPLPLLGEGARALLGVLAQVYLGIELQDIVGGDVGRHLGALGPDLLERAHGQRPVLVDAAGEGDRLVQEALGGVDHLGDE